MTHGLGEQRTPEPDHIGWRRFGEFVLVQVAITIPVALYSLFQTQSAGSLNTLLWPLMSVIMTPFVVGGLFEPTIVPFWAPWLGSLGVVGLVASAFVCRRWPRIAGYTIFGVAWQVGCIFVGSWFH
jgi:hypothetical protein